MLITLLKSKLHMATITSSEINYEGSIAIDPALLEASGLYLGEKVAVLNFTNGNRFETYTIKGEKGEIGLRGPAAKLGSVGDKVIVLSYAMFTPAEISAHKPKVVILTDNNSIKSKNPHPTS